METLSGEVIHILPCPIGTGHGIGDYALRIAQLLKDNHNIDSRFATFSSEVETNGSTRLFGFVSETTSQSIDEYLNQRNGHKALAIVLHFDHYACALVRHIRKACMQYSLQLCIVFHEVRFNSTAIAKLKDFVKLLIPSHSLGVNFCLGEATQAASKIVVVTAAHISALPKQVRQGVISLPCISNVGELDEILPLAVRKSRIVVFGSAGTRRTVYSKGLKQLLKACHLLEIDTIYDVGPLKDHSGEVNLPKVNDLSVVSVGLISATEVSLILSETKAGFLNNYARQPGALGKSGVFAAFAAHGVLPISAVYDPSECDGIYLNRHYITPDSQPVDDIQSIANAAHHWYQGHNLKNTVETFASILQSFA